MAIEFLTTSEKELLLYRSCGLTREEVADKMGITVNTVDDYSKKIHKKLNAPTAITALGVAIATKQITYEELKFILTTHGLL
jgi:DNA-binding NarL/FixJ family response regulator